MRLSFTWTGDCRFARPKLQASPQGLSAVVGDEEGRRHHLAFLGGPRAVGHGGACRRARSRHARRRLARAARAHRLDHDEARLGLRRAERRPVLAQAQRGVQVAPPLGIDLKLDGPGQRDAVLCLQGPDQVQDASLAEPRRADDHARLGARRGRWPVREGHRAVRGPHRRLIRRDHVGKLVQRPQHRGGVHLRRRNELVAAHLRREVVNLRPAVVEDGELGALKVAVEGKVEVLEAAEAEALGALDARLRRAVHEDVHVLAVTRPELAAGGHKLHV
mmetsp:Transcript_29104/g.85334  ORF Transcript_29104/g.85334 Transcript_29104/m.85334 type:complete len:276 (+) Transcript_29104:355-1182(+)